jgi:hypothetical protein
MTSARPLSVRHGVLARLVRAAYDYLFHAVGILAIGVFPYHDVMAGPIPSATAVADGSDGEQDQGGNRFLFVPYPITEPAVGTGLLAGPVWMRAGPPGAVAPSKPQAYGVGGLWTDEGSRGLFAFDHRAWGDGAWQTTVIVGRADLQLRYPGLLPGLDRSIGFDLNAKGVSLEGERLLGDGPDSLSFKLFSGTAAVNFGASLPPELKIEPLNTNVVSTTLTWSQDTRDDIFSPSSGHAISLGITTYPESLGSGFNAQLLSLKWMVYYPGPGAGVFGVRTQTDLSYGAPPFYLRPYISLRGIPALRYPGDQVGSIEAEYRFPISARWDVLAFSGFGAAHADVGRLSAEKNVTTVGVGVRLKMKKLFGLTLGIDVAHGPDGSFVYLQIGNPWTK